MLRDCRPPRFMRDVGSTSDTRGHRPAQTQVLNDPVHGRVGFLKKIRDRMKVIRSFCFV